MRSIACSAVRYGSGAFRLAGHKDVGRRFLAGPEVGGCAIASHVASPGVEMLFGSISCLVPR